MPLLRFCFYWFSLASVGFRLTRICSLVNTSRIRFWVVSPVVFFGSRALPEFYSIGRASKRLNSKCPQRDRPHAPLPLVFHSQAQDRGSCVETRRWGMLGIIAAVLIILWLLGFFAFHITAGFIHIVLVIGLILLVLHFVRRA